jgi:hypothetical protein
MLSEPETVDRLTGGCWIGPGIPSTRDGTRCSTSTLARRRRFPLRLRGRCSRHRVLARRRCPPRHRRRSRRRRRRRRRHHRPARYAHCGGVEANRAWEGERSGCVDEAGQARGGTGRVMRVRALTHPQLPSYPGEIARGGYGRWIRTCIVLSTQSALRLLRIAFMRVPLLKTSHVYQSRGAPARTHREQRAVGVALVLIVVADSATALLLLLRCRAAPNLRLLWSWPSLVVLRRVLR